MIIAECISKSYGRKSVLNNISLELQKGKISVLFGPSGCGKTTLCRNLALLDYPDAGIIKIFDKHYSFPSKKRYKDIPYPKINFVYQQLFLWPHLTNQENILLAVNNKTDSYEKNFEFYTKFFDITKILNQYPNESSLGQRQRIAITRALILNPDFLFLDEITSALDIVQTKKIIELTLILKNQNVGLLIVTHNLIFIEKVADNVLFMSEGTIVETGTEQILRNPKSEILKGFLNGKIS